MDSGTIQKAPAAPTITTAGAEPEFSKEPDVSITRLARQFLTLTVTVYIATLAIALGAAHM